jgi:hypothetical protein
MLDKLEEQLRRLRRLSDRLQGRLAKSAREHRRILEALRSGDPAQAEAAMRAHLDSVVRDFATEGEPQAKADSAGGQNPGQPAAPLPGRAAEPVLAQAAPNPVPFNGEHA